MLKFALLNSNLSTSLTAPDPLIATYPSGFVTLYPFFVLKKEPIPSILFNFFNNTAFADCNVMYDAIAK